MRRYNFRWNTLGLPETFIFEYSTHESMRLTLITASDLKGTEVSLLDRSSRHSFPNISGRFFISKRVLFLLYSKKNIVLSTAMDNLCHKFLSFLNWHRSSSSAINYRCLLLVFLFVLITSTPTRKVYIHL